MTSLIVEKYNPEEGIISKNLIPYSEYQIVSKECLNIIMGCYNKLLNIDYKNNNYEIFEFILNNIKNITKSDYVAICEKKIKSDDERLKFIYVSDPELNKHVRVQSESSYKYHSIHSENLIGRSVKKNNIIISNDINSDDRALGIPSEHFKMQNFLGIPLIINELCIGQIILANNSKEDIYTEDHIYKIYPLIKMCTDTLFNLRHRTQYSITDLLETKAEVKKTKDDFLASISHEIRTPLTGIMGSISLLPQVGPLNSKQMSYMNTANTCSIQLLDLINSILDFSKLNSNTMILSKEPFDLKKCVEDSLTVVDMKLKSKGLKIDVNYDNNNKPFSFIGDSKRLIQVLVNLLTNAIKFTDKGSIKVDVSIKKKDNDEDSLTWLIYFDVKDTGIGIPYKDQDKLFKVFSQLTETYNRSDGVGLGLVISKEIINLMGGKIKVHSDGIGKGSTFSFFIEVEENIDCNILVKKYSHIIEDLYVLSVDDKQENLLLLDDILYKFGINSIMCNNAEQILRYLEKNKKYSICIIDIFMPICSGITLAQKIRELYPHVKLIGISSILTDKQGEELFDIYLYKPYNPLKIIKGIIDCLTQTKTKKNSNIEQLQKLPKECLKILIAEDNVDSQYMIKEMILLLGYKEENLKIVSNGKEAVKELETNVYQVSLLDIKMPVMNGIEASKHIRQMKNKPAIIAMSASILESDKNTYMKFVDGFLAKPFTIKELETILNTFVLK